MKLPEIKGRNKIRDAAVCVSYERWHDSEAPKTESLEAFKERLSLQFKLSQIRIYQILRSNNAYIPIDRNYEKQKRIRWLKRQIARKGDRTCKDAADLIEQLRKEIEGDKPLIDQSTHTHITGIILDNGKSDEANNIPNRIPEKISI